jgi:5-methylcytosine-specific restriction endonuclease McrA
MELTRIQSSGTLWYTKKYLVLYYFVFLSKDIQTNEYVDKVIEAFDIYIDSLDDSVKDRAAEFFYPDEAQRNFKSDRFKKFMQFADRNDFANSNERMTYYQNAKKCYFALLMGTGGQSGVKEKVISAIKTDSFKYSSLAMQNLILEATAEVCCEKANNREKFYAGDVARIISERASKEIEKLAAVRKINKKDVLSIIADYPCSEDYPGKYGSNKNLTYPQFSGVESDCFASVRNERQILYYYGYFHSKSSGAADLEASSLTPIGEISINANSHEFLAIWEHQKIKMISQPPTAEIKNIPTTVKAADKFEISYKPYMDILDYIMHNGSMSLEQYKYIVSRRKHSFDDKEWDSIEKDLTDNLSLLEQKVKSFKRARDDSDEDGRKELLKYILGIRCDLPMDRGTNAFNICSLSGKVTLESKGELSILSEIYGCANEYKIEKYGQLFLECEKDLKSRYSSFAGGKGREVSRRTKLHWDLYNIYPDKYIIESVAVSMACVFYGIKEIGRIGKDETACIVEYIKNNLKKLFKEVGIKTDSQIRNEVTNVVLAMKTHDYKRYIEVESDNTEVLAQYREESVSDLMSKIGEISNMAVADRISERTRNKRLISLLKSYYMAVYMQNNTLKCESCGNETFITKAGEPYVEFHHLIPFNIAYGPDHYLNLFALCPICHRKVHFLKEEEKRDIYVDLDNNNYLNKHFVERLMELNRVSLLKTYHLDYLLDDNAITQGEYDNLYGKLAV